VNFKAYESSSAQKRLYIINHLLGDSTLYNEIRVWVIKGKLDPGRLKNAVEKMSRRHESLRTSFLMKGDKVLQKVYDHIDVDFNYTQKEMEILEPSPEEIEAIVGNFLKAYDLGRVPLWQVQLVQLNEHRQLILLDFHHIIADGISMDLIIEELASLYMGMELPQPGIQYVDFALWQNDLFQDERSKLQEAYWLEVFEGEIPVLDLPTDFPRPVEAEIDGTSVDFEMDDKLTLKVNELAQQHQTSLYVMLLAVFNILLSKYSNQEDIVIGTPISGRTHQEFENIIGMFVNTLAMKNRPVRRKSFKTFLQEVSQNVFDAFENQDYQFEMLVEKVVPNRQLNRNPVFDVMFALQNYSRNIDLSDQGNKEQIVLIPCSFKSRVSKFDLTLQAFEVERHIAFKLEYRTSLFRPESIDQLTEHFLNIFREVSENPDVLLSEIGMISGVEREQLLYVLNDTAADFPADEPRIILPWWEKRRALSAERKAKHAMRHALCAMLSPTWN
jgi:fengycin family lipopeptide synthetase D